MCFLGSLQPMANHEMQINKLLQNISTWDDEKCVRLTVRNSKDEVSAAYRCKLTANFFPGLWDQEQIDNDNSTYTSDFVV